MVKRPCQTPGCDRAVHQQRQTARFCVLCREQRNRDCNRDRMKAIRASVTPYQRVRTDHDLTTAEIEARLAAGDAERRRTRTRLT